MNIPVFATEMVVHFTAGGAWLAIGWLFVLGAAIGSFLNVVAYRLPLGMSLSRPGSRCPACGCPIRSYDNVPIFAWLWLGGRCRDCKAAISPRYPIVELLVGVVTAVLGWSAIRPLAGAEGGDAFVFDLPLVAFRLLVVYTLVCAALLEFDGSRAPLRLLTTAFVAGIILSTVWPEVRLAPPDHASAWGGLYDSGRVLASVLLFGSLAWPLLVERTHGNAVRAGTARVIELGLAGALLGLPGIAAVAVFSLVCYLAMRIVGRFWRPAARFGWAAAVTLATLIWIVAGAGISARWPSVAGAEPSTIVLAAGVLVAVLAAAGRVVGGRLS